MIYETGRVQVWGNAIRKVSRVPLPDRQPEKIDVTPPQLAPTRTEQNNDAAPTKQLELF